MVDNRTNPLTKYFRQPKIYLRLPSKGRYYPAGSLDMPDSGELPVYAMTAKDELMFKTPDALLNGESVVEVIKSCVPNIKDPWKMPSIDSDAILIAIRLATYGEKMGISTMIPGTTEEREFEADLRTMLDRLADFEYLPYVEINPEITVELRPSTYKEFTQSSIRTFEEQRIFKIINDDTIADQDKLQAFTNSFKKLTDITLGLVVNSIVAIDTPDGKVTDLRFISDFFENSEKDTFRKIMDHLQVMRDNSTVRPLKVITSEEDREKGAPEEFEVPITFDQANFFA
jgi:hypothetical protein